MKTYKQRNGYDHKKYLTDRSKEPGYNLKVTEPGQAISVKNLIERYERGRPKPTIPQA